MGARAVPAPIAQLPNALTILRFALVPVFVVLLARAEDGQSWAAAAVFAIAAITDQVDGWLARRLQVESQFGKYADPLADRLMIDVAVVMLFIDDRLPWAALVIIIGRDLLLVLGTRFALPARLRVLRELPREARHLGPLPRHRARDRHASPAPTGRS